MPELIQDFWQLLVFLVTSIVYVIRMEGKIGVLVNEIEMLKTRSSEDRNDAKVSRDEVHRMLKDVNDKLDRLIERQIK